MCVCISVCMCICRYRYRHLYENVCMHAHTCIHVFIFYWFCSLGEGSLIQPLLEGTCCIVPCFLTLLCSDSCLQAGAMSLHISIPQLNLY